MTARSDSGQATVELVALLPIVVAVVYAVAQLLAAGVARELAGHAAHAGAVAVLQGEDPEQAARDAVPGWSRVRMQVRVRGGEVAVRLRPPSPLAAVGETLASTRRADAGKVVESADADSTRSSLRGLPSRAGGDP